VISLAVGGLSDYFLDSADYKPYPKPWNNTSPTVSSYLETNTVSI
jgi:hypothetical protein